jgi:hypothetical protein
MNKLQLRVNWLFVLYAALLFPVMYLTFVAAVVGLLLGDAGLDGENGNKVYGVGMLMLGMILFVFFVSLIAKAVNVNGVKK